MINLNKELSGTGIYAGHVAIGVWIGEGAPDGFPTANAEQIAPLYWQLQETRDQAEAIFSI